MESKPAGKLLRFGLPIAVVAVGAVVAMSMIALKPDVPTRPPTSLVPVVRVLPVELRDVRLTIASQGNVRPRTESQLVAEIAGKIIETSPSFVSGGFFEEGDVLVRIDPFDYRQALVAARADLARAKLRLAQEDAEAEVARREWAVLGDGEPDALTSRAPQLEDARAALAAAQANVERAERNLARTQVRAPYPGRIRMKSADVGQFVGVGTPLASIYSVDVAEVRLPLPDEELAFAELPLGFRDQRGASVPVQPRVVLSTMFAGQRFEWEGRIVRTEGEIDETTRMIHAVAEVRDPYARGPVAGRPPLEAGMFVEAEIDGRIVEKVAVLPREALRQNAVVWVVDPEQRIRLRDVDVLRTTPAEVFVSNGLDEGELVCLSALEAVTEGMQVRLEDGEQAF
jgi:RND family efflux transporter MFP subunit